MKSGLLIIDMQKGLFMLDKPIYDEVRLIKNINSLINQARKAGIPIIYMQHCGGECHPLENSNIGYQFIDQISVTPNDIIIQKKHPDSFQSTELHSVLSELAINNIILAGMQTEYCLDSTCRRAYSLGYNVTLVGDAHSTCDGDVLDAKQIVAHHNEILGALFASVILTDKVIFNNN
ncbi:cysteine hydrolase [Photorhabdus luminescens]|uniref:Isochorismatase-like domain-containing protein n=1 Tax=Photorhabdus akhurstii TaxID=171438 RepID=A0ABX8M1G9_9GAMM|nr:cysteine hydrolase family protein [Photorhabdus akhurstii]QXF35449.1 hypothetical protein B0X70_21330 [Photorhabdus akhurstii]UJD77280.1 cysteine hydrolase [Photorhabdus luminescens]